MSDLRTIEKLKLESYFEMGGGYFLDFSNNDLERFIAETLNIEIYSDKYAIRSGSKANRVRALWELETDEIVALFIREAIKFDDATHLITPVLKSRRNPQLRNECLDVADRLDGKNPTSGSLPPASESQPLISTQSAFQPQPPINTQLENQFNTPKNKVFIVHGHDNLAKEQIARFIAQLGYDPVILHEQASSSKTIIEKIESYADQVCFAVVLYTECDIGSKVGASEQSFRARQNVVFEHGYFIAKLNRDNVTAMVKGNVEIPNDFSGVVYLPFDDAGAWKIGLAKEMKASGCKVDFNRVYDLASM